MRAGRELVSEQMAPTPAGCRLLQLLLPPSR